MPRATKYVNLAEWIRAKLWQNGFGPTLVGRTWVAAHLSNNGKDKQPSDVLLGRLYAQAKK
jgi:hypothetical protein